MGSWRRTDWAFISIGVWGTTLMTTTGVSVKSLFHSVVREPIALAIEQPHQIFRSAGSIAIMAQFAASEDIVHPIVGYVIAAGVEWTYLRGLATAATIKTTWTAVLSWSAFIIMVLW